MPSSPETTSVSLDPEMQAAYEMAEEDAAIFAEMAAEEVGLAEAEAEDSAADAKAEEWFPLFYRVHVPRSLPRFPRMIPSACVDVRRRRGPSRGLRCRTRRRSQRSRARDRPRPRPRRADTGRLARGRLGVGAVP